MRSMRDNFECFIRCHNSFRESRSLCLKIFTSRAFLQPSSKELLSIIKSIYNLSPFNEGTLIVGEIKIGCWKYRLSDNPLLLDRALVQLGWVIKPERLPFYLIRQSSDEKAKLLLEIGLRKNKQLLSSQVILEKGYVVFVPRGCVDGKLLPTKVEFPGFQPRGNDYPIHRTKKRITC